MITSIIAISFATLLGPASSAHAATDTDCNCVIFRFDDIQDSWLDDVQAKVLTTFMDTNTKVTPGIIMNSYGSDSVVVDKIQQGKDAGLFELGLHGWDHVDYSQLSLADQERTLADANEKLEKIHGDKSNIFITPYNSLNADTLVAMKDKGLEILSADLFDDNGFLPETFPAADSSGITSIPYTVYYVFEEEPHGQNAKSVEQLYSEINDSIDARGYAVVMLHPPDFAEHSSQDNNNGNSDSSSDDGAVDVVNNSQIDTLTSLIDKIKSDGKSIVSFNELATSKESSTTSEDDSDDRSLATIETRIVLTGGFSGANHPHASMINHGEEWAFHMLGKNPFHHRDSGRATK